MLKKYVAALVLLVVSSVSPAQTGSVAGYDVILLIGQSNMAGYGSETETSTDPAISPQVFMWDANNSAIVPAQDPLVQNQTGNYVGPGLTLGKAYAASIASNRKVLLVGAARGSTALVNGPWTAPGGELAIAAVARANAAMTAAGAGAKFVGIAWDQGESDIINGTSSTYQSTLISLFQYLRSNINGASTTTPIVVTEMTYPWMIDNLNANTYVADQYTIESVFHALPDTLNNTAWTSSGGLAGDVTWGHIHFSALSQRQMGRRDADRLFEAGLGLPQPQTQLVNSNGNFFDIGRGTPGIFPVNYLPAVNGTVTASADVVRGTVAQISQGSGYLSINVPSATFNGSYTKMAWFKPGAPSGYYNNLVSANNPGQAHYLLAAANGGSTVWLVGGHSDGNSIPITVAYYAPIQSGAWINIALTYDASQKVMTLFFNGAPVSTASNVAPAPALSGGPVPVQLGSFGANQDGSAVGGVDGAMAGNRIWTSALTAAQIAALYNYELKFRAGF